MQDGIEWLFAKLPVGKLGDVPSADHRTNQVQAVIRGEPFLKVQPDGSSLQCDGKNNRESRLSTVKSPPEESEHHEAHSAQ